MRMLAGAGIAKDDHAAQADIDWSQTVAGPWLAQTLAGLRAPKGLTRVDPGRSLQGTCGPTSKPACNGSTCSPSSSLEACLADDMGLGKTIQVLSLLLA